MTLIASFEYHGSPVFLGDLLLTADRPGPGTVSTPLVKAPNSLLNTAAGYGVWGTAQKLVLLHEHLCMAWSGSKLHAAALARHLRSFVTNKERLDYDELRKLLVAYPRVDYGNIDLIIYSCHGSGTGWFSNLPAFDLEPLTNIRVGGSGTARFIENIELLNRSPVANADGYQTIAMQAMAHASLASAQQVFDQVGIAERWGGGFELVTFDGERMRKVDRVLTVQWELREVHTGVHVARLLPTFMYQFYRGDVAFFWRDEGAESGEPNGLYMVEPLFPVRTVSFERPQSFPAEWVINLVRINSRATVGVGCFVDFTKPGVAPDFQIIYTATNNQSTLQIKREYFQRFFSSLPNDLHIAGVDLWGNVSKWP